MAVSGLLSEEVSIGTGAVCALMRPVTHLEGQVLAFLQQLIPVRHNGMSQGHAARQGGGALVRSRRQVQSSIQHDLPRLQIAGGLASTFDLSAAAAAT